MERRKERGRSPDTTQDFARDDMEAELADRPEVLRAFRRLPAQLWARHFARIQDIAHRAPTKDPADVTKEQMKYLASVTEARHQAMEEVNIGDRAFAQTVARMRGHEALGARVEELLESPEGSLGAGTTARVKSLRIAGHKPLAVKYLLTPTEKTLSADAEYDMLREVEIVSKIEVEEERQGVRNVLVPHPYFFYKSEKVQCYGMEEIRGVTIEQLLAEGTSDTLERHERKQDAWNALRERYEDAASQKALREELETFMRAVHEVCLHGDIKLANFMIDEGGYVYLIDFGQSVSVNTESEKTRDQFDNLKVLERDQAATCLQAVLNRLTNGAQQGTPRIAA